MLQGAPFRLAAAVLAAMLVVVPAAADDDNRARSRVAFANGAQALDEGRAKEALAYFEEAERLYPHYSTWYNIALCERALGHPVLAAAAFQRFLEGGGASISAAQIETVASLIKEAEGKIATVRIEVTPQDAKVMLDGAVPESRGEIRVDPGPHVLEASAKGHRPGKKPFVVPSGGAVVVGLALDPETPAVATPTGPRLDSVFWVTAGLSGAALAAGGVTGVVALSDANAYADPTTPDDEADRRRSRGEVLRVVADVCFGAAIVGGVTATLLATLRPPAQPPARGVQVQPGVGSLRVVGRF